MALPFGLCAPFIKSAAEFWARAGFALSAFQEVADLKIKIGLRLGFSRAL